MKLSIKMYALLKDYFGDCAQLDLPEGATIEDVIHLLVEQSSESKLVLEKCRVAINQEMIARDQFATIRVNGSDLIDVLPPSSGG